MTQRPDLFGAALPGVGVMDMLRFHKFTIGWAWVDDYGSPDDPEEFTALYAYSPLHNIKPGTMLPGDADHHRRPRRPRGARRTASSSPPRCRPPRRATAPVLIRIETKAGHGAGTALQQRIATDADRASLYGAQPAAIAPPGRCSGRCPAMENRRKQDRPR